jgi:hypothetical protein
MHMRQELFSLPCVCGTNIEPVVNDLLTWEIVDQIDERLSELGMGDGPGSFYKSVMHFEDKTFCQMLTCCLLRLSSALLWATTGLPPG